MTLTRQTVADWLRTYVRAWETYDRELIGSLFSEKATYQYHPFDEPVRGRAAIVESWLEDQRRDEPGTYEAEYQPIGIAGEVAVANGRSRYFKDRSRRQLLREYDNIFVLRFDSEGQCQEFREWYMPRRGQKEASAN